MRQPVETKNLSWLTLYMAFQQFEDFGIFISYKTVTKMFVFKFNFFPHKDNITIKAIWFSQFLQRHLAILWFRIFQRKFTVFLYRKYLEIGVIFLVDHQGINMIEFRRFFFVCVQSKTSSSHIVYKYTLIILLASNGASKLPFTRIAWIFSLLTVLLLWTASYGVM